MIRVLLVDDQSLIRTGFRMIRRLIEEFAKTPAADAPPPPSFDELTPRELEVLQLIARGMSNARSRPS